jgi:hypothetical protein
MINIGKQIQGQLYYLTLKPNKNNKHHFGIYDRITFIGTFERRIQFLRQQRMFFDMKIKEFFDIEIE